MNKMDNIQSHLKFTMRHLQDQVAIRVRIKKTLEKLIAPELAEFLQIAKLENQTLTVMADNAAVATHMKLMVPDLINGFQDIAPELQVTQIKCKVSKPRGDMQTHHPRRANPISNVSQEHIKLTANAVQHEGLKRALEKLARTTQTSGDTK